MLRAKAGKVVELMGSRDAHTAGDLAVIAEVSQASARKVLRGEPVSVRVAQKVMAALGDGDLFDGAHDGEKVAK